MRQSAIITGASDGIGASLARSFAKQGFRLGLLARRTELLQSVAEECRRLGAPQVEIAAVDVTDSAVLRRTLGEMDERLGGAGVFIANAGRGGEFRPDQDSGAEIRKMFEVNVLGAIDGIEFMKTRMIARRGGTIAAVTSIAAARGLPLLGAYSATKAALATYLESLRMELRSWGVRVVEIAPGFVDTAMTRSNRAPKPFMVTSEAAAGIFTRDILRGKSRTIAPWQYRPAYPLLRMIPNRIFSWVGGKSVENMSRKLFARRELLKDSLPK